MRIMEFIWDGDDDEQYGHVVELYKSKIGVLGVDWKVYADDVLERMDEQLAAFGLEVVQHETGGDEYDWHIEERAPGCGARKKVVSPKAEYVSQWYLAHLNQVKRDANNCRGPEDLKLWREQRREQFTALKRDRCNGTDEAIASAAPDKKTL